MHTFFSFGSSDGYLFEFYLTLPAVHNIARPGETISSIRYESRIGGKGANQAISISRANQHSPSSSQSGKRRVQFHGTIGPDGLWIKNKVKSVYGLESDGILVAEVSLMSTTNM